MPQPHKHAEVIKAWADGAQIQYLSLDGTTWCDWEYITAPSWHPSSEYRVPHKWQKEMDAAKAGKTIQWCGPNEVKWYDWATAAVVGPNSWGLRDYKFRIKPERVVLYDYVHPDDVGKPRNGSATKRDGDNVVYVFEDGKLISAEVL